MNQLRKLLRTIFLIDLFEGLWVTLRYQHPKNIYTEQYPAERPQVAERYRGAPRLNKNPDTNETLCISCDLCAIACPEQLIVVTSIRNPETRRKELTEFTYDTSRCMFCGLCEDACPVDALERCSRSLGAARYTAPFGSSYRSSEWQGSTFCNTPSFCSRPRSCCTSAESWCCSCS